MSSRRRGSLLLEMAVTLTLLTALVTLAAPGLHRLRQLEEASANRAGALRACSSALTYIAELPWDQIDESIAKSPAVKELVQENLPSAELKLDVRDESGDARRITATVEWPTGDQQRQSIRLATWRYPTSEASR